MTTRPPTDCPELTTLRRVADDLYAVQVERVPPAHQPEARKLLEAIRSLALWYGRRLLAAQALERKDAGL